MKRNSKMALAKHSLQIETRQIIGYSMEVIKKLGHGFQTVMICVHLRPSAVP